MEPNNAASFMVVYENGADHSTKAVICVTTVTTQSLEESTGPPACMFSIMQYILDKAAMTAWLQAFNFADDSNPPLRRAVISPFQTAAPILSFGRTANTVPITARNPQTIKSTQHRIRSASPIPEPSELNILK